MLVESPRQVAWGSEQRASLPELTRSRTAPLRRVPRARAALACADGGTNAAVARALGVHLDTVRRRRKWFAVEGLAALEDRPCPGRSHHYGPDVHLTNIATVTFDRPITGSQWARRPRSAGSWPTSASGAGSGSPGQRIRTSTPGPPRCARAPCTARPTRWCSVDEKTAMQARSRGHPTRPAPAESSGANSSTAGTAPPPSSRPWTYTPGNPATTRPPSSASCACWIRASTRP
ncbi:helix-turn-helix domain-containing protein [Streptomyces cellulosae]